MESVVELDLNAEERAGFEASAARCVRTSPV